MTNSGSVGAVRKTRRTARTARGSATRAAMMRSGSWKYFHEDEEADKRRQHQDGIDPAGHSQSQAGDQVALGRGQVGLQIGKLVDPDDGGDEKGQGQADRGAHQAEFPRLDVIGPQVRSGPKARKMMTSPRPRLMSCTGEAE